MRPAALKGPPQARRRRVEIDARHRRVPAVAEGQVDRAVAEPQMIEGDAVGRGAGRQSDAEAAVLRLHEVEPGADQGGVDDLHLPAHQGGEGQFGVERLGTQPRPSAGAIADRDAAEAEQRLRQQPQRDRPRDGDGRAGGLGQLVLDHGAVAVPIDHIGSDEGRREHADQQDGQDGQAVAQGGSVRSRFGATGRDGRRGRYATPKRRTWKRGAGRRQRLPGSAAPNHFALAAVGQAGYRPVIEDALRRSVRAHRLAVQDVALSRRKPGFDSPWARQLIQLVSPYPCLWCPVGVLRTWLDDDGWLQPFLVRACSGEHRPALHRLPNVGERSATGQDSATGKRSSSHGGHLANDRDGPL